MSLKSIGLLAVAVCSLGVALAYSGSTVPEESPSAAFFQAPVAGPWVQLPNPYPQYNQSNITINVAGVPFAGTYTGYSFPGSGTGITHHIDISNGVQRGFITINRDKDSKIPPNIYWMASGGVVDYANGGASIPPLMPLIGPDYNVSGTGKMSGNLSYGGGSNITISVSP